jgi:uncharacterized protein
MENLAALFPLSLFWARGQGLSPYLSIPALIFFGLMAGVMIGFFGGGGRFLIVPLLHGFFSIPYNVAIGSDVGQMTGISTLNMLRFKRFSSIDFKLSGWMLIGTLAGVETGAQLLEALKGLGSFAGWGITIRPLSLVLTLVYGIILVWIGTMVYREARGNQCEVPTEGLFMANPPAMTARLQHIHLPPMISLPVSGIAAISLWVILGIGFISGLLVGFLGGGGGFIRMPALVYVVGCPMVVAIGTDLFESVFSMAYGTMSHTLKGNIDPLLVMIILICGALGTMTGGVLARRFCDPKIRQFFAYFAFAVVLFLLARLFI